MTVNKDPNVMLTRIRSALVALEEGDPATTSPAMRDLIENIKALDNHLSWGGTAPADWNVAFPAHAPPAGQIHPVHDIIRRM